MREIEKIVRTSFLAMIFWLASSRAESTRVGVFGTRMPFAQLRQAGSQAKFRKLRGVEGIERQYREGVVLAKFKGKHSTEVVSARAGEEENAARELLARPDVEFAELDFVLRRQSARFSTNFAPARQWHHAKLHSLEAWAVSLATHAVTAAVLDTPFQMNHPDLAPNTVPGWNMLTGQSILEDPIGYYHSTITAGLIGAVINDSLGVSGMANCWLMPIDIGDEPTVSDMHDAVIWAADHGVRVVNLSWDGAYSSVINEAGAYLKEKARGMLFMSGVNGRRLLNYPNQPDIYAVSMTDSDDQPRSAYGNHIDFAAPGWEIYSTTTNASYELDSGTSYSAPMAAGMAAWIMSVNPTLGPSEIEQILKVSVLDLGPPGWDSSFGWGRLDFGLVARNTFATLPVSRIAVSQNSGGSRAIRAVPVAGATYRLARAPDLMNPSWTILQDAIIEAREGAIVLTDLHPPEDRAFYRVEIALP